MRQKCILRTRDHVRVGLKGSQVVYEYTRVGVFLLISILPPLLSLRFHDVFSSLGSGTGARLLLLAIYNRDIVCLNYLDAQFCLPGEKTG